jgi:CRISP-associated protein Cas1
VQITKTKTDVIIDESIYEVRVHAGFLRLYAEKNEILGDIPIYQIRSVLIEGGKINIPAGLIKLCCQEKIPIHVLTNRHKHYGSLHFTTDSNVLNRQVQFLVLTDEIWRLYLAKQILYQKISIQKKLLQHWGRGSSLLEKSLKKINSKTKFQGLMGTEGQAATIYWEFFGKEVPGVYDWPGRLKYPTKDPVNSMLSLAYGLLATQCQTSLTLQGLDPYFGILHKTNQDRPALTYDVMEVYRSLVVDLWVLGLLSKEVFKPEDFTFTKEGVCTLLPHPKNEFFRLWFKRLKYYNFSTNYGQISLHQFLDSNTSLLLSWFEKITTHKERNTGRFDRLPERLIVFKNIEEFSFIE